MLALWGLIDCWWLCGTSLWRLLYGGCVLLYGDWCVNVCGG